jgi:hypothetical protein
MAAITPVAIQPKILAHPVSTKSPRPLARGELHHTAITDAAMFPLIAALQYSALTGSAGVKS